jgi:hypothetical protein
VEKAVGDHAVVAAHEVGALVGRGGAVADGLEEVGVE